MIKLDKVMKSAYGPSCAAAVSAAADQNLPAAGRRVSPAAPGSEAAGRVARLRRRVARMPPRVGLMRYPENMRSARLLLT